MKKLRISGSLKSPSYFKWVFTGKSYIYFALIIFICLSCEKEKEPCYAPDKYQSIDTILALSKVPYKGYETLRFRYLTDSTTDTITYTGQGVVKDTIQDRREPTTCDGGFTDMGIYHEVHDINFKADTPGMDLVFREQASGQGIIVITLQKEELHDHFDRIDSPNYLGYHSELTVNGKLYYSVNHFADRGNCGCYNIYYTTVDGIIRIELENQVWELID